uniref:Uncharacterized protein n=1 Tax=Cyprinus carpio TaxID=7962 RepID=A0A8C2KZI6_CYPCA
MDRYTIGSDHVPILSRFGRKLVKEQDYRSEKYNYSKARWEEFNIRAQEEINNVVKDDIDKWNDSLCFMLIQVAEEFIPKFDCPKERQMVPWWNEKCTQAVLARNKAYRRVRKFPMEECAIEYKRLRAKARRVIKDAKRESWRKFCGTLGPQTNIRRFWDLVHRMTGEYRTNKIPLLKFEGQEAVKNKDKADLLVKSFKEVHSSESISPISKKEREKKLKNEKHKLEYNKDNMRAVNAYFSVEEVKQAIASGKDTTPGRDRIGYQIFLHLDDVVLEEVLELINAVWECSILPREWKHATIVPILKPGKNADDPKSYRPIALTAVLCKIMERMVTDRLVYMLEKQEFFVPYQSGFRTGRSTMDSVLVLDLDIRRAMANKEVVMSVFLDIEKAYDTVWKEGLMIKLYDAGVRGRMLNWIKDFLKERTIQVRVDGSMSSKENVENGTPQGSVISPVLFNVMINDIFSKLNRGFGMALFADDAAVWKRGRNLNYIYKQVQQAINKVEAWADEWGFRISVSKSKYVVFGLKRKLLDKTLSIYNSPIEKVKSFKFLGVWFEERMTWKEHINNTVKKCERVINTLRCLVGMDWGASRECLMMIFRGIIRANIDYGCMVYRSASESVLKKLDVVQAKALRICGGAMRSTPLNALLIEMGETTLELRRNKLFLFYWTKLRSHNCSNPARILLEEHWELQKRDGNKKECGKTSIGKEAQDIVVNDIMIAPVIIWPPVPPWLLPVPNVDLSILDQIKKYEGNPVDMVYNHLKKIWPEYVQIFTDGSMNLRSRKTAIGVSIPQLKLMNGKRLTDSMSAITAELVAILLALEWVEENGPGKRIICSDSSAALMALKGRKSEARSDLVVEVLVTLNRVNKMGSTVGFIWVPAHIGVQGNEEADEMARSAVNKSEVELEVMFGRVECKSIIQERTMKLWQKEWNEGYKGRHYYSVQPTVGRNLNTTLERKESVILTRLRLGHCALNFGLARVGKHPDGRCRCGQEETVNHVIMECSNHHTARRHMISELLECGVSNISVQTILNPKDYESTKIFMKFLHKTGLYARI